MDEDFEEPHLDPEELEDIPSIEQEIFDMVYQWGRVGIVADYTAPAYQEKIGQLIGFRQERPF